MSIVIQHRFLDRLVPKSGYDIRYIFIGTFNPAAPQDKLLTDEERKTFEEIKKQKRYQNFSLVRNFYDRPPNRFWGIMDRFANPDFYKENIKRKSDCGLKFYTRLKMDRDKTYERQKRFCQSHSIFITDIVREIRPLRFDNIYKNFPDSEIEKIKDKEWNTTQLIEAIRKLQSPKLLLTFRLSNSIPDISKQIELLESGTKLKVIQLDSCSGRRAGKYEDLIHNWGQYLTLWQTSRK